MTKILLVEDDKSLREIYGVRLLAEGYDIVSAGDGEEALAMAIKDRPSLIVSDVMMPKISGFDMLDILRSTTETKDIRVIMMTALSSEEQRQRGVALGADRYLVKSQVGIEDVVRTVHEVLGDAPVAAPTQFTAPRPVAPVPPPPAAPTVPPPAADVPIALPTPAPVVMPPIAPAPVAPPQQAPVPMAPPAQATPLPTPGTVATVPSGPVLPQPTAPFSTPRPNTLASRVIEPLPQSESSAPDFANLMNQELINVAPQVAQPPAAAPVAAPTSIPSGMTFEETPRPAVATVSAQPPAAAPVAALPPLPQPPQAPNPGV